MGRCQATVLDDTNVKLQVSPTLNLATLLPSDTGMIPTCRDCLQVKTVDASRLDLADQPLEDWDTELFTGGSSFMEQSERHAGYMVGTVQGTTEAGALPPGTWHESLNVWYSLEP